MVLAPVVAGLLIIYFCIRRSAADEMESEEMEQPHCGCHCFLYRRGAGECYAEHHHRLLSVSHIKMGKTAGTSCGSANATINFNQEKRMNL